MQPNRPRRTPWLAAALAAATTALAHAGIERMDLGRMAELMDDAVVGEIVAKHAVRIDHPIDGPELYFTHLTIDGRSLVTGEARRVVVTYNGGWIDPEHGSWVAESPTEDETRVGNEVVAFYAWTPDMGGELAANALVALHGGLYRVAEGRRGPVVLGRGAGYAIASNQRLPELEEEVRATWRLVRGGRGGAEVQR